MFEYWRQCLGGQARRHWDAVLVGNNQRSVNAFEARILEWFAKYMEATAYQDQKEYLLKAVKPYGLSVKECASRWKQIVSYMQYMPGYPAGAEVYSATEEKMGFFRMMRPNWKARFEATGTEIQDDTYTWDNLVQFMHAQERLEIASRAPTSRGSYRNERSGRGRGGRGGRQGGRGYGRSSGRYNNYSNNYSGSVRSYYGEQGGPPPQRARYSYYNQGYGGRSYGRGYGYGAPGMAGPRPQVREDARTPRSSHGGRFPTPGSSGGRGRSSAGRGRGGYGGRGGYQPRALSFHVEDSHVADDSTPVEPPQDAVEESSGDQFFEQGPGGNQEHWMEDQFGVFENAYGYDEEYDGHYGDY